MTGRRFISFPNLSGQTLRGVLHEPASANALGVCILLLSPGIKGRVGPHRLYLKIAARLAPRGFHVLRFDYHGLGDSDGEVGESLLVDMYNTVHSGRYTEDTIAAMNWVEQALGIRRFVGSGLCGGSISALLTAEKDPRIECLMAIGLPTVLEGGAENWAKVVTQQQLASMRGSYLRKIMDPKSILRFISGQSSYRVIWKIIRQLLSRASPGTAGKPRSSDSDSDNTNPRFASAFMAMLRSSRPMILIFSGADRLRAQFAENFESYNGEALQRLRHLYEIHVIPNANHVLSDPEWVEELLTIGERWLASRYASH